MHIDKDWQSGLNWRKAKMSIGNGACVEVAKVRGGVVVRDSKLPQGSVLCYSRAPWQTFTEEAKKGGFDLSP